MVMIKKTFFASLCLLCPGAILGMHRVSTSYRYRYKNYTCPLKKLEDFPIKERSDYAQKVFDLGKSDPNDLSQYEDLGNKFNEQTLAHTPNDDYFNLIDMQQGVKRLLRIKKNQKRDRALQDKLDDDIDFSTYRTNIKKNYKFAHEKLSQGALLFVWMIIMIKFNEV